MSNNWLQRVLLVSGLLQLTYCQTATKAVIHYCDVRDVMSCGRGGVCLPKRSGSRCECPKGWMGPGCSRPCQDVYRSCTRWKEEDRCSWARPISPFFSDNCALSCNTCKPSNQQLAIPLPPILEPIAWFVGKWETRTSSGERFPEPMNGGYYEVLDVTISEVPMFDRPPVNITVVARSLDGQDTYQELGFITGKPFNEDTGFVEIDKPKEGDDLVGLEMVSSTGLITIEEGVLQGKSFKLDTVYKKSVAGEWQEYKECKRLFRLLTHDLLEERVIYIDNKGESKKWLKRYTRTRDYLKEFMPIPANPPPPVG